MTTSGRSLAAAQLQLAAGGVVERYSSRRSRIAIATDPMVPTAL
jgi:hypothetical protein